MKDRSPWIELHLSAPFHSKTYVFAEALGVDRITALGHICSLWLWALEQAQDGDLSRFPDQAVADGAGWRKKAPRMTEALIAAGYIGADRQLHEWDLYTGKLMEKRRKDRDRKRRQTEEDARKSAGIPVEGSVEVARHSLPSTTPPPSTTPKSIPPLPPAGAGGISPAAQRGLNGSRRKRDQDAVKAEATLEERYLGRRR